MVVVLPSLGAVDLPLQEAVEICSEVAVLPYWEVEDLPSSEDHPYCYVEASFLLLVTLEAFLAL